MRETRRHGANRGRTFEEIAEYRCAVEVHAEMLGLVATVEPPLLSSLELALENKVAVLCRAERYEEALALQEEAIARWSVEPRLPGARGALNALSSKAWILKKLGRAPEAIAAYRELARTYGNESDPYVVEEVAYALVTEADLLRGEGRYQEVITVIDELLGRLEEVDEPSVRLRVVEGAAQKGFALGRLGRWEDAVALEERTVARFAGASDSPELAKAVARVMDHLAYSLERINRFEDASAAWGALLERDREAGSEVPADSVADALLKRAKLLLTIGRVEDAIASADEFALRTGDDPDQLPRIVEALGAKGLALAALERYDEAIAVFEDVIERGRSLSTQPVRREVVLALINKATILRGLERREELAQLAEETSTRLGEAGLDAFAEVIDHHATLDLPAAQPVLAAASYCRTELLVERGRRDEALVALADLISRFEEGEEESIQEIVSLARALRERLVSECE